MQNIPEQGARLIKLRPFLGRLLAASIAVIILSLPGFGLFLCLSGFIFIPWLLISIYFCISDTAQRRQRLPEILIWLFAYTLISGIHAIHRYHAKTQAQQVVELIQKYADQHGKYPPDLASIGVATATGQGAIHRPRYYLPESGFEKPILIYQSTFIPFDKEIYSFDQRTWKTLTD